MKDHRDERYQRALAVAQDRRTPPVARASSSPIGMIFGPSPKPDLLTADERATVDKIERRRRSGYSTEHERAMLAIIDRIAPKP